MTVGVIYHNQNEKLICLSDNDGNIYHLKNFEDPIIFNVITLLFFNNKISFIEYDVNTNTFTVI